MFVKHYIFYTIFKTQIPTNKYLNCILINLVFIFTFAFVGII